MEAKEFLKSKGWTDSDFMDSGMVEFISKLLTEYAKQVLLKDTLPKIETFLEIEGNTISEGISDIITISSMNPEMVANKLIREQFIVINRKDLQIFY